MKKIKQQWNHLSLRKKWALATASVIFISFAIVCTIVYISLHSWLLNEEKQSVNRSMEDLTAYFESAGSNLSLDELRRNKGLMNSIIDKKQTVRILNEDGVELVRINDTVAEIPLLPEQTMHMPYIVEKSKVGKTTCFVATSTIQLGQFQGYVQLTQPLTSLNQLMRYMLTAMLLMGIVALVASWFVGSMLASVLLQPIQRLSKDMMRVAATKFEEPIQIEVTSDDEVGDLVNVYKEMMGELENAFVQQQRFIADASHELRTPIQVLEGHLSLLNRWGKDDRSILEESLVISEAEVQKMKQLIEELLALARREKKDEHDFVIVVEQVEDVASEMRAMYDDAQINVHYDEAIVDVKAAISNNALRQILNNLIQNAVRYNSSIPIINIYLTNVSNNFTIVIEDNGIGMSQQSLEHIFERFYRVDKARSREHGGTGLGLSIVAMLVERYDGKLTVSSEEKIGTKFTLHLPLYE